MNKFKFWFLPPLLVVDIKKPLSISEELNCGKEIIDLKNVFIVIWHTDSKQNYSKYISLKSKMVCFIKFVIIYTFLVSHLS